MKKLFVLSFGLLLSEISFSQSKEALHPDKEIRKVFDSFMQSIVKKDSSAFLKLFAQDQIGWSAIIEAKSFEVKKQTDPAYSRIYNGNHKDFIRFIVKSSAPIEEKFYNLKVTTDNSLASLSFDYGFYINGKEENWGQENWELVKTGDGWKIIAVYWSQNLQAITPEPKRY